MQALHDVARQAAGIGHDLDARQHLRALQRHAARHDQADVAASEDDDAAAAHVALKVQIALRRAGGKYARRAVAGNADRAARALAAAHCEHHGFRGQRLIAALRAYDVHGSIRSNIQHHRVGQHRNGGVFEHVDEAARVFGAAQLLLEAVQAEAVVNALVQNAAKLLIALDDEDVFQAVLGGAHGRGQTGGAAADDNQIIRHTRFASSLVSQARIQLPARSFRIWVGSSFRSRARISSTRGPQKPP